MDEVDIFLREISSKENGTWEYSYHLKDDGEQMLRIPGDAVAYAGLEDGRFRFFRRGEVIGNHIYWLSDPGYYRWMKITSRLITGGPERKAELI